MGDSQNDDIAAGPSRLVKFVRSVIPITLALAGAVIWLVWSYGSDWQRITPLSSGFPTTSMEPYEVVFRTAIKSGKLLDKSAPPLEWKLVLPRAFISSERGGNDRVYRMAREGKDHNFLSLDGNLSSDGESIVPSIGLSKADIDRNSFIFFLSNVDAIPEIKAYESCVPRSREKEILEDRGVPYSNKMFCYERSLRCTIYMHADGWDVRLAVTKDLYSKPERTCQLAHAFLDKYTVKRDDIR